MRNLQTPNRAHSVKNQFLKSVAFICLRRVLVLVVASSYFVSAARAADMESRDEYRLRMLENAFRSYYARNGHYPKGDNAQIVRELSDPKTGIRFVASGVDAAGNLLDAKGKPYVFFFSDSGWVIIASIEEETEKVTQEVLLPPAPLNVGHSE